MINSRKLEDLNPRVKMLCAQFIASCAKQNIDILITSTYRDGESQDALYAQGRTLAGNKVTNAKGGQSFHNWLGCQLCGRCSCSSLCKNII